MTPAMLAHELREAAHIIRLNGLCQGSYYGSGITSSKGSHCVIGSMFDALGVDIEHESNALNRTKPLIMAVAQQLGYEGNELFANPSDLWPSVDAFSTVTSFNDTPGRTAEQVAELLEETALAVEVKAGQLALA